MVLKHQADLFADSQWSNSNFIIQDLKNNNNQGSTWCVKPQAHACCGSRNCQKKTHQLHDLYQWYGMTFFPTPEWSCTINKK